MLIPLLRSMRLRTLPLSLAGVACGGVLGYGHGCGPLWDGSPMRGGWTLAFLFLTTACLQILTNLSNEMGDYRSGVDTADRQGPHYSLAGGHLTERQMWRAINAMVVLCCLFGFAMVLCSFGSLLHSWAPRLLIVLGAMAVWAATHYTLGAKPYGYRGLGDIAVFIFFGLVSVLGAYYVLTHRFDLPLLWPAIGMGLLSVGVLNVNNVRDMESDAGIRRTIPLRVGEKPAKVYQFLLVIVGFACFVLTCKITWLMVIPAPLFGLHLFRVRTCHGRDLDSALPLLVITTALTAILYTVANYGL